MGIIAPKNRSIVSKALIALLVVVLSPILITAIVLYFIYGAILYLVIWLTWRKQIVVFVYSDSPIWKEYVEREILPPIQDRAVILNWSERKKWKTSVVVLAFRYFGGYRNFNPIGMVFRPFRFVKTYRFFEAFKDFKHGDSSKIDKLKKELFDNVEGF